MRPNSYIKSFTLDLAILFLAVSVLASCNTYEESKNRRAEIALHAQGPIYIAIAWPSDKNNNIPLINGVTLAVDEINQAGGVMGRKLETILFNTDDNNAHKIAKQIVKNENIVAVVGHITSETAIPASITYEENGVIFLAPSSTNPALTSHDFKYVFRTTPSDLVIGRSLAQFTHRRGYKRILILDDNSIYGTGLSRIYFESAVDLGLEICSHKAFFKWQSDYRQLINGFTQLNFDVVFLAGFMPNAGYMIKQFREMGIQVPFIAGDSLDLPDLPSVAGPAADGTIVPTVFNPYADNQLVREFMNDFMTRFHSQPETLDALGYDTIKLLSYAFEKSRSTVPSVVSSTLRFTKHWQGVTGDFTFDGAGELKEKPLYFKEIRNRKFEFVKE